MHVSDGDQGEVLLGCIGINGPKKGAGRGDMMACRKSRERREELDNPFDEEAIDSYESAL